MSILLLKHKQNKSQIKKYRILIDGQRCE